MSIIITGDECLDHSLERAERVMVRWMCGVSLKDSRRSVNLYSLLGFQSVADVVRHGSLRWFGHLKHKGVDDWVSACRNVVVAWVRSADRGRKTWRKFVKDNMKLLGLQPEWAVFRDIWRDSYMGQTSNPR